MRMLSLAILCVAASVQAGTNSDHSIVVGGATLTLGMTPSAVRAQLADGHTLAWHRDKLPKPVEATKTQQGVTYTSHMTVAGKQVTLNYSDENGEHAYIADPQGTPLAALVFEAGKLTRVTKFIALQNESSAPTASWLMAAVAPTLASWQKSDQQISVHANHFAHGLDTVDEMIFDSGSKQLVLLTTGGRTSVVENLGRGDIPSVSTQP